MKILSPKSCNILVHFSFWCIYYITEAAQAVDCTVFCSTVIVGVMTCTSFHYMWLESCTNECVM